MSVCLSTRPYTFQDLRRCRGAKGSVCILLLFSGFTLGAQEHEPVQKPVANTFPVPAEPNQLFYLQRDPDDNTVIYQLNTNEGMVDAKKPVNVYWIRYAEGGTRTGLNFIQRSLAYGVTHKALDDGVFELRLAAYKDHPLRLAYCEKSETHKVYTSIDKRDAVLERIFVRIDGGSMLSPNIVYFELTGRDITTQKQVSERITPVQ